MATSQEAIREQARKRQQRFASRRRETLAHGVACATQLKQLHALIVDGAKCGSADCKKVAAKTPLETAEKLLKLYMVHRNKAAKKTLTKVIGGKKNAAN